MRTWGSMLVLAGVDFTAVKGERADKRVFSVRSKNNGRKISPDGFENYTIRFSDENCTESTFF